jgi:uncharacterized membrane protein SpoIIM required for sporulation
MDYARFVRQRAAGWDAFARLLLSVREGRLTHASLEDLAFQYRQILHDHALVRHRFPRTGAAQRLQQLALEGTRTLSVERGRHVLGPYRFLTEAFPRAFRRSLLPIGPVAIIFITALLLGFSLTTLRPGIGATLLGPERVEGLKDGHLWTESLVSSVPASVSSSFIATNNMGVALTGWAGGALGGLGAIYVALLNGFMLGAIVSVTWHFSMAANLLEFVSAHGPLELTLIVVTSGAGLGMGQALVAAGDLPRREAIAAAGRDALVVLLGCLPWFLLLGTVEAWISPAPGVAWSLKLALGLSLEASFLTFAWNPFLKKDTA